MNRSYTVDEMRDALSTATTSCLFACDGASNSRVPQEIEIPEHIMERIRNRRNGKNHSTTRSLSGFTLPDIIPTGERNSTLLGYAGHLRGRGIPQDIIQKILISTNKERCQPPLDEDEVLSVAGRYEDQGRTEHTPSSTQDSVGDPQQDQNGWPVPQEVSEVLPPVPPFDERLLPTMIRRLVGDAAERICCPVEFPAAAAVVALGSVIGAKLHCKPYGNGTWLVPANLWGKIVSPPGALKTPAVKEVLAPVNELDRKAAESYKSEMREFDIDMKSYDGQVKAIIKSGTAAAAKAVPVPAKPTQIRYIVNDSTYEKLIEIAADNPEGFLVFRDELGGWFHSLNKENQKEARGLYNEGWNGTSGYATDRIGRGHVRADKVCLSLLGTIQPGVLKNIIRDAVSGGVGDDGLVQRFQMMVYPDPIKTWKKVDRPPDTDAQNHWKSLLEHMASLDPKAVGASHTIRGEYYLPFDSHAQRLFDRWRDELENRIRGDNSDEHPAMLAHLGKYRSLVPKLALILHLAGGGTGPIDARAVARAIYWAKFLETHARRVYHIATNDAVASAATLANKIRANRLGDGFTRSDVLMRAWANLRTADEVRLALTVLCDLGWLVSSEYRTGGRPAERFFINPGVKRAA